MTSPNVDSVILKWAEANVPDGVKVVFANQNAPRPDLPYVTVFVTATPTSDHANESAPNSDGFATIEDEQQVMASVQCFGAGAMAIVKALKASLTRPTQLAALRGDGVPFIRVAAGPNDMTESVDNNFEPRAGIDLEFRAVYSVLDEVGVMESVEGTGTADTGTNTTYTTPYQTGV